jgi:hypothetical protein
MLRSVIRPVAGAKYVLLVIAVLVAPCELVAAGEARNVTAPLVFSAGFESGGIDTSDWIISGNSPAVTTEVARAGRSSMKSTLDRYNSRVAFRTEVVPDIASPKLGEEYWYGFSIYLPKDYVADPVWEVVAQWHDTPDAGEEWRNAILAFYTDNGRWSIANIWDDNPITQKDSNGKFLYGGKHRYELGPYEVDQWTDWVVRVKWSYRSDGILQIWKNGKLVVDQQNKPNCFNDSKMPYPKIGIYKGWKDPTQVGNITKRVLFHDEFRIAGPRGSYESVAPGGGALNTPASPSALLVQ